MSFIERIDKPDSRKGYSHFDLPVSYREAMEYVENPEWVRGHAFYPLISTAIDCSKYKAVAGKVGAKELVPKERHVAYASHLDHRVYQCYALRWFDGYKKLLDARGIGNNVAAYMPGQGVSNISAAADAIRFIREQKNCTVLIGDFADFFTSLDHRKIIDAMRNLYVDRDRIIPEDSYRVLRSVLRYAEWPLDSLLELRGFNVSSKRDRVRAIKMINGEHRPIIDKDTFRANKDAEIRRPWRKDGQDAAGIPQGLAVSGVLSNIYMLDADTEIFRQVKAKDGYYSRYCDDFIVVIPGNGVEELRAMVRYLQAYPGLSLSDEKTKYYQVSPGRVQLIDRGCGSSCCPSHLSYLGFDYDGSKVRVRQKTVGKFYGRYYRNIRRLNKRKNAPSNAEVKAIYRRFSYVGAYMGKPYSRGNFISYVKRAQRAFPDDPIMAPFERLNQKLKRDLGR